MSTILSLVLALVTAPFSDAQVVEVGMVAPDIVAVTLREGDVQLGELVPYAAEIKQKSSRRASRRNF